jgi:hypothetical protein
MDDLAAHQPSPMRQPRRCAIAETEVRRPRAPWPGRGRPGHGRDAARRSEPGPTHPTPHGIPVVGPPPSLVSPATPLKGSHWPPTDFSPPCPIHLVRPRPSTAHSSPTAQASSSLASRRRSPSSTSDSVRASPSSTPSGERPSELLRSSIDRRLLTPRVSLELQDPSTLVDDHRSYPAAVEPRRR